MGIHKFVKITDELCDEISKSIIDSYTVMDTMGSPYFQEWIEIKIVDEESVKFMSLTIKNKLMEKVKIKRVKLILKNKE